MIFFLDKKMPRRTPIELVYVGKTKRTQTKRKIQKRRKNVRRKINVRRRYIPKITTSQTDNVIQWKSRIEDLPDSPLKTRLLNNVSKLEEYKDIYMEYYNLQKEALHKNLGTTNISIKNKALQEQRKYIKILEEIDNEYNQLFLQLRLDALKYL